MPCALVLELLNSLLKARIVQIGAEQNAEIETGHVEEPRLRFVPRPHMVSRAPVVFASIEKTRRPLNRPLVQEIGDEEELYVVQRGVDLSFALNTI